MSSELSYTKQGYHCLGASGQGRPRLEIRGTRDCIWHIKNFSIHFYKRFEYKTALLILEKCPKETHDGKTICITANEILNFNRQQIRQVNDFITGHFNLEKHVHL